MVVLLDVRFCSFVNSYQYLGGTCCLYLCIRGTIAILFREYIYGGAVKSLAQPKRKHAIATEESDFHISYL